MKPLPMALTALVISLFMVASAGQTSSPDAPEFLTAEEQGWLTEHHVIRLGVGIAFPPYQWVEGDAGNYVFKGVVSEYVKLLEKRLNIRMEVVFGIKFGQALDMGRKKEIDLFPCLARTPERTEFLLFTKPYISYPSVIITREDAPLIGGLEDLNGRRIAVVGRLVAYSKLTEDYSHLKLTFVQTENTAGNLVAVSTGRADACITDLGVASYYIQKLRLPNLKVAAPTDWSPIELAMGVRDDWPMLRSIIQKALNTITREEKDDINKRWVRIQYEPGINAEQVWRWTLWIGGAVLLGFLVFFFWNRSLHREIDERKRVEAEREELIVELKQALSEVKQLSGLLPICSNCKKIRDDTGYWGQVEEYITKHSDAKFSHGICPDCMRELYPDMVDKVLNKIDNKKDELL